MTRQKGGFTLMELLITVACSSLVMLAAMSLLLVCMRVDRSAQDAASRQGTARIVLSLLEDAAGTGTVERVETVGEDWTLLGGGEILLRYSSSEGALKTSGGTVVMGGITASSADLQENNLLTLSIQTGGEDYKTSIYCRTAVDEAAYDDSGVLIEQAKEEMEGDSGESDRLTGTQDARYQFLEVLSSQYGSAGEIKHPYDQEEYEYFSEWYIGGYADGSGWNEDTPWCACFLSWAVAQKPDMLKAIPRFANVGDGMDGFQDGDCGYWLNAGESSPLPGDFIFFDWDGDNAPDHVGAVLLVQNGTVYTIEGNSGGKVAVHTYSLNDDCVLGYGLLDWKATDPSE